MGNRYSRRQDAPANSAETAPAEEKAAEEATAEEPTAEEPTATQPAEESGITQTQEAVGNLDVVVEEPVALVACTPPEECVSECKEVEAPAVPAPLSDEPEPVAKEPLAPAQPEPLVSVSETTPEPAPEPVPEPEPTSEPEAEVEDDPEPVSESVPAPAEALEQQTDLLSQESLPEPEISSPPLIDMGVPDATPEPISTPPSLIPAPAFEPSDVPVTQECQDSAEVSAISTCEPEEPKETSPDTLMEVEAAENLEQLVNDVNEESVSGLLKNLDLKGNDLVTDLIPTDVSIPDDTPIIDMSASTELM